MTDQTISELLVLFLLAIACARIFFFTQVKSDTLSVLPLASLIISVLNICAWGLSLIEIADLFLSFFATIWNIRALLRLNARLVIDHYGPLFIIASLFNLVLVAALAVLILICRPVKVDAKKANVSETVTPYTGTFTSGFKKSSGLFPKTTARVWKYESNAPDTKSTAILFMADNCASTTLFRPMFIRLARDGYTVYTAEFYAKDMKWFGNIRDSSLVRRFAFCKKKLLNPKEYASYPARFAQHMKEQYKALADFTYPELSLCPSKDTIIFVGDELALQALPAAAKQNADLIDGSFDIAAT